jgi:hypothetical protein
MVSALQLIFNVKCFGDMVSYLKHICDNRTRT